jgi:hypothetical protein
MHKLIWIKIDSSELHLLEHKSLESHECRINTKNMHVVYVLKLFTNLIRSSLRLRFRGNFIFTILKI